MTALTLPGVVAGDRQGHVAPSVHAESGVGNRTDEPSTRHRGTLTLPGVTVRPPRRVEPRSAATQFFVESEQKENT